MTRLISKRKQLVVQTSSDVTNRTAIAQIIDNEFAIHESTGPVIDPSVAVFGIAVTVTLIDRIVDT